MASTIKVTNIDTPDSTGNITLDTSKFDIVLISVKGKLKYEKFLKIPLVKYALCSVQLY